MSVLTLVITIIELFYLNLLSKLFSNVNYFENHLYGVNLSAYHIIMLIFCLILIRYGGLLYLQSLIVKIGDTEAREIKKIGLENYIDKRNQYEHEGEFIFELSELVHLFIIQIYIPILRILSDSLMFIILYVYLMLFYPIIGVVLFLILLLYGTFYIIYIIRKLTVLGQKANSAQSRYLEFLSTLFIGGDEIHIVGRSKYFIQKTVELTINYNKPYFSAYFISIIPKLVLEIKILILVTLLALLTVAMSAFENEITIAVVFLIMRVGSQLSNIVNMFTNLKYGRDTIERIERMMGR